jgi:hypothetical protein
MDSKKLYSALFKLTTTSPQWKALQGIFHEDGNIVASNDASLVAVKFPFSSDLEGAVIKKDGGRWTETQYPSYKMLLPRKLDLIDTAQYLLEDIVIACKRMPKNEGPSENPEAPAFLLNVGGSLFDPALLLNVLNVFVILGEKPKLSIVDSIDNRLALISEICTGVVVPAKAKDGVKCEAYSISEMLDFGDLL